MQMKHPRSLKAYVHEFDTQMDDTSKMDEFSQKYIILSGVSKAGNEYHIQIHKSY